MRIATLLAIAAVATTSSPALAGPGEDQPPVDPRAEAIRLAAEADALGHQGDLLGAAARYRASYALDPRNDILCNIGFAFYYAADLPRAHLYLGQCLPRAGSLDPGAAADARSKFTDVEGRLRAGPFAPIDVTVDPPTATFTVGDFEPADVVVGARTVWLPFGAHTVTAHADGFVDRSVDVRVDTTALQPIQITLARQPALPPPPPVIGPKPGHHRSSRRAAWLATGATVVVGAGAGVAYLLARSAAGDAGDYGLGDDQYADRVDGARLRQHLSWGLAGAAAIGAATSGWLWYRATRTTAVTVEVTAAAGGPAAILRASF